MLRLAGLPRNGKYITGIPMALRLKQSKVKSYTSTLILLSILLILIALFAVMPL